MDFELRKAKDKMEREQRERKEKAKARLERDRRAKAEAAARREALEAVQLEKRLEAARARAIEEQQQEETNNIGGGVAFVRVLEASQFDGYGDKIKLPPSCFSDLSGQGALDKGPMYFRLSKVGEESTSNASSDAKKENMTTYSGVLEFTATEGYVELPTHVWTNLFAVSPPDIPLIEVRYVRLPKGTYAKLKPEGMGFSDLPNHKALLETTLRSHATLSEGDIVTIKYGDLLFKVKVLELKPASSVSVLETDIEVDIESSDSVLGSEEDQHVLLPLEVGKPERGVVEEGKFKYYRFSIDDAAGEKIASGLCNLEIKIESEATGGDTDIYVSRHPLIFPTPHRHEWSSHDMGSKILVVKPKNASNVAGSYSIGVFGFKGFTKYNISVNVSNVGGQRVGERAISLAQADANVVECRNCRRLVPSHTAVVHEAYCVRHNFACQHDGCGIVLRREEAMNHVHCTKCQRAFQQSELEKHMKVYHEPLHCPCGVILEKEDMVEHQSSKCPLRLIICQFCGDMVQAGSKPDDARDRLRGFSEHESICGSRTAPCDCCGRSVMLKEMDIHLIAVHQKN